MNTQQGEYPEQSQATTILVLGILGLVACGFVAPAAWIMGNKELAAIAADRRPPEGQSHASTGRILGIIGTVLLLLGFLFGVAALLAAIGNASMR